MQCVFHTYLCICVSMCFACVLYSVHVRMFMYVVCVCMFMPVVHLCVVHVFACVPRGILTHVCTCEGHRLTSDVLPYCSALFVFRQALSLNQSSLCVTIDWPVSPWDLPVSTIPIAPRAGSSTVCCYMLEI